MSGRRSILIGVVLVACFTTALLWLGNRTASLPAQRLPGDNLNDRVPKAVPSPQRDPPALPKGPYVP
jgi:hypothetical protein